MIINSKRIFTIVFRICMFSILFISCQADKNGANHQDSAPSYNIIVDRLDDSADPQNMMFEGYLDIGGGTRKKIMQLRIQSGKVKSFTFAGDTLNKKYGYIQFEAIKGAVEDIFYSYDDPTNWYYMRLYPNGIKQSIINVKKNKGLDSLVAEYDKEGKAWNMSKLQNGNGFYRTWHDYTGQYDTTFVSKGRIVGK